MGIKTVEELAALPERSLEEEHEVEVTPDGRTIIKPRVSKGCCSVFERDDLAAGRVDGEWWSPVLTPVGWRRERVWW